jgi:hypothetical protein
MSSQPGFVTKDGRLSAKGLKRIFKDGVLPKKSAKRPKVAKAKPIEAQEEEHEEIPIPKTFKCSEEELEKKRRLQEAAENLVKCGANTKELLTAPAEAEINQSTSIFAENVTSGVSMPPDSPPYSLEAWERANLSDRIQEPRGRQAPPISLLLKKCIPFSSSGGISSRHRAPLGATCIVYVCFHEPSFQPIVRERGEGTAGIAHSAFQPAPGHMKNDDQVSVPLDAVPPTPLTVAATASIASQVSDPHCGLTKVIATTRGACNVLQCVLQALIHACSTPRSIDIQNIISRYLGI